MKHICTVSLALLFALIFGCSEDENKFSIVPSLGFTQTGSSIVETNSVRVGFHSNVVLTETVQAVVAINNFENLTYGVDYVTEPASDGNTINIAIDPETEEPYFEVFALQTGTARQIAFTLSQVSGNGLTVAQQVARNFVLRIAPKSTAPPVVVAHDFEGCTANFATPDGFIEAFEPGTKEDRGWGCRAFGRDGSRAPRASAFGGTAGEDRAWLIMNPVAVGQGQTVSVNFWAFSQFAGPGIVKMKWSSNYSGSGNPLAATWNDMTSIDSQFPAAASQTWTEITETFTNISGTTVYFAFVYTEGLSSSSSSYDIDDLTISIQ